MGKICVCCGKEIGILSRNPMPLTEGKVMCAECSEQIRDDVYQLYYLKDNVSEFDAMAKQIIEKTENLYSNEAVKQSIVNRINSIRDNIYNLHEETDIKTGGVGTQIKTVSNIIMWLGIIASISSGINMIRLDSDFAFFGIIVMAVGCVISWLSTICLRGFGQLVENSDRLVAIAEQRKNSSK